jgi:hypothetical protein
MAAGTSALRGAGYPERAEAREGRIERMLAGVRYFTGGAGTGLKRQARIVAATDAAAAGLESLSDAQRNCGRGCGARAIATSSSRPRVSRWCARRLCAPSASATSTCS